jgi:hypothetical protein
MTEEVTELTSTGAAEETAGNAGNGASASATDAAANNAISSGEPRDGTENTENLQQSAADPHRLLERGVALHVISADEDEDNPREMTEEEEASAKAVLDDPSYDQEGLALTGGDWFSTIKKAALESKLTEKELAARMKKAKISQSSLENEVFMGSPSCYSSADTGPGTLQDPPQPSGSKPPYLGSKLGTKTVAASTTALGLRGLTPPQLRLWAELGG